MVSRCLQCVTLRQGMFCTLKCSLVKANRTTQLLDCLKNDSLVMLIRGIQFFMDRFYSSLAVFYFLWARKTKAVGTCMPNRKELPRRNVSKKLKRDECVFMRRDHLLCLKWKDTRDVLCLSTAHKMTTTSVEVRGKNGVKTKSKPDAF